MQPRNKTAAGSCLASVCSARAAEKGPQSNRVDVLWTYGEKGEEREVPMLRPNKQAWTGLYRWDKYVALLQGMTENSSTSPARPKLYDGSG